MMMRMTGNLLQTKESNEGKSIPLTSNVISKKANNEGKEMEGGEMSPEMTMNADILERSVAHPFIQKVNMSSSSLS